MGFIPRPSTLPAHMEGFSVMRQVIEQVTVSESPGVGAQLDSLTSSFSPQIESEAPDPAAVARLKADVSETNLRWGFVHPSKVLRPE